MTHLKEAVDIFLNKIPSTSSNEKNIKHLIENIIIPPFKKIEVLNDEDINALNNLWYSINFFSNRKIISLKKSILNAFLNIDTLPINMSNFINNHIESNEDSAIKDILDRLIQKTHSSQLEKKEIESLIKYFKKLEDMYKNQNEIIYKHPNDYSYLAIKAFCFWAANENVNNNNYKDLKIYKEPEIFLKVLIDYWQNKFSDILCEEISKYLVPLNNEGWGNFYCELADCIKFFKIEHSEEHILKLLKECLDNYIDELINKKSLEDKDNRKSSKKIILSLLSNYWQQTDETGKKFRSELWRYLVSGLFTISDQAELLYKVENDYSGIDFRKIRQKLKPVTENNDFFNNYFSGKNFDNKDQDRIKTIMYAWEWASFQSPIFEKLFEQGINNSNDFFKLICAIRNYIKKFPNDNNSLNLLINDFQSSQYANAIRHIHYLVLTDKTDVFISYFNKAIHEESNWCSLFRDFYNIIEVANTWGIVSAIDPIDPIIQYEDISLIIEDIDKKINSILSHPYKTGGEYVLIKCFQECIKNLVSNNFINKDKFVGSNYIYSIKKNTIVNTQLIAGLFEGLISDQLGWSKNGANAINEIVHSPLTLKQNIDKAIEYYYNDFIKEKIEKNSIMEETKKRLDEIFMNLFELQEDKNNNDRNAQRAFIKASNLLPYKLERFRVKKQDFILFYQYNDTFSEILFNRNENKLGDFEKFSFEIYGPMQGIKDINKLETIKDIKNIEDLNQYEDIENIEKWFKDYWIEKLEKKIFNSLESLKKLFQVYWNNCEDKTISFAQYLRISLSDMNGYLKYYHNSDCCWVSNIENQPDKMYIDSLILIKMIRKFIDSSLKHAHSKVIGFNFDWLEQKKIITIFLGCDDHYKKNPGWKRNSLEHVFSDKQDGNEMKYIKNFCESYCISFDCYEMHKDDDCYKYGSFKSRYNDVKSEERTMQSSDNFWKLEPMNKQPWANKMSSNCGSLFKFDVPLAI